MPRANTNRFIEVVTERLEGALVGERLDLALFVDAKHDRVRRGIHVEADDVTQLLDEGRVFGQFELPDPMRLEPVSVPYALHGTAADADLLAIAALVQWVAS